MIRYKLVSQIPRYILSFLFIISGILKSIDVFGTTLKIKEYIVSINYTYISDILSKEGGVVFSVFICFLEVLLGLMLLYGVYKKISSILVVLVIFVFTILSCLIAFSVIEISDCGCFGDAIKMSNEATFFKNIILLSLSIFNLYIVISEKSNEVRFEKWILIYIVFFSVSVPLYSVFEIPAIDFLEFHRGVDLKKNNLAIYSENIENVKDSLLEKQKPFFAVLSQKQLTDSQMEKVVQLKNYQETEHNIGVCIFSSVPQANIDKIDLYYVDIAVLKSMIRTNFGVMLIMDSKIVGKWRLDNFRIKKYNMGDIKKLTTKQLMLPYIYFSILILGILFGLGLVYYARKYK